MLSTSIKIIWALLFVEIYVHNGNAGVVEIGAFLGDTNGVFGDVFGNVITDAINRVRNNRTLLPEPHSMQYVAGSPKPVNAVFTAIDEICTMINSERPSALIILDDHCPDCSDLAGIISHGSSPVISLDPGSFESGSKAFKMYPSPEDMSIFFMDILQYFKWRAFNLVVDSGDAFANFEGVMQEVKANDWNVTVITIDPDDLEGTLIKTTTTKTKNILLYCVSETTCKDMLDKGMELNNRQTPVGPLNSKYTWILGNLDLSLPEKYKDELEDTNAYMTYFTMNFTRERQYTKPASRADLYDSIYSFPMREKLAFDAILTIGHALGKFVARKNREGQRGDAVLPGDTQMLTCPAAVNVAVPNDLAKEMMNVAFEGMTGNVAFDELGNRVNYTITIFSGRGDTLRQLRGEWTQNPSYLEDRREKDWQNPGRLNTTAFTLAKDRKIRIVSIEVPPFLFLREKLVQSRNDRERYVNYRYKRDDQTSATKGQYTGNGRYEGYVMEFLERIRSAIRGIDFEYEVELVPDGKYGAPGVYSRIWNGMVGEVVRGVGGRRYEK